MGIPRLRSAGLYYNAAPLSSAGDGGAASRPAPLPPVQQFACPSIPEGLRSFAGGEAVRSVTRGEAAAWTARG